LYEVKIPLVTLPVTWDEVRRYSVAHPPAPDQKRRYRYTRRADFPDTLAGLNAQVTENNYQYFFYRDLATLGSAGVRHFSEPTS
jgi:hypothetical protein